MLKQYYFTYLYETLINGSSLHIPYEANQPIRELLVTLYACIQNNEESTNVPRCFYCKLSIVNSVPR